MRILMIEDDRKLCESVKYQLEKYGYTVDFCHDGEEGLYFIKEGAWDLILLDRMLPGMDGLCILEEARRNGIHTPVIMVTALGELFDRVQGLNLGADDYIVKPFAFEELLARIRSTLRRPSAWTDEQMIRLGDIIYESNLRILKKGEVSCSLSKREGDLFEFFLRNFNQTMPRGLILTRVWGLEDDVEDGNLDNYIHFLRRRLKSIKSNLAIKTVRGVGYRLEVDHAS